MDEAITRVIWGFLIATGVQAVGADLGIKSVAQDVPFSVSPDQAAKWLVKGLALGLLWGFLHYRKQKKQAQFAGLGVVQVGVIFAAIWLVTLVAAVCFVAQFQP